MIIIFTRTHLLIGETISTIIRQEFTDKLDAKAFQYGCMIPDYCFPFITIPHYKDKSFAYVTGLIQKARPRSQTNKEKQCFSTELGIIAHYISDYFCEAHNYPKYDNCMKHLLYEGRLAAEFKQVNLQRFCCFNQSGRHNLELELLGDLPAFINKRHLDYRDENRHMKTDIAYCLEVATVVILNLIYSTQRGNLQSAA